MEVQELASGLIVPAEKPAPPRLPRRFFGRLEIEDEGQRLIAREAFDLLWRALNLGVSTNGIRCQGQPSPEKHEMWRALYDQFGKMLLGDEIPEHEILT